MLSFFMLQVFNFFERAAISVSSPSWSFFLLGQYFQVLPNFFLLVINSGSPLKYQIFSRFNNACQNKAESFIIAFQIKRRIRIIFITEVRYKLQFYAIEMNHHFMPEQKSKSDIAFYNAFKSEKGFTQSMAALNFLKASGIFVVIIIDLSVNGQSYSDVTNALIFNFIASVFGLLIEWAQICQIYGNPYLFLVLADETGHAVISEQTINYTSINQCASPTVFLAENQILESALAQREKKLYISIAKTSLSMSIKSRVKWVKGGQNFYSILSFLSMIYSIIMLATVDTTTIEEAALITYVVIVGLSHILVILVLLLVCLIPLLCLGICLFICCCKPSFGNEIQLVEKQATTADIVNVGGDCSICYQSIGQKDKIFVLQCSDKHIFHADCLRHWTKVKNTCPICRHDIPMGSKQLVQE